MATNEDIAVEASGLVRSFGELKAVNGIDLSIRRGEIFGIVGPDGAGKTTTLRLLVGLIDPGAGDVHVFGRDVRTQIGEVRDTIGYMPQQFGQYLDLTVEENMRFYADLFGVPDAERKERFERLLHMTRMEPFRGRRAGNLSGGMKQKLALMCTLLHRPQALFLDEPTNGVDPVSRRDFWAILYDLVKDGLTVLVTTSYLDEAERCNRVALMYKGRIIEEAPPDEIERSVGAACFAIRCADLRQARTHLREHEAVVSVEAFGPELHAFIRDEAALKALVGELEQQGLAPVEWRPIQPSLEDSFIALVRRQERREEQAA
ncbi:MAG: ABC transporter ATP-binding protein [Bryobacterales bacterium]|nr:ABC transporter ATP-binding protein [Acidobacteriota bacterium]MCB9383556.1 ABC transporter ATP-binding protein [Bryobacterales bacterium]